MATRKPAKEKKKQKKKFFKKNEKSLVGRAMMENQLIGSNPEGRALNSGY